MKGYNFTDRTRRVLALSREESIRLKHEYIGTEHILLALIKEGGGVGSAVLTNTIDVAKARDFVESIVKKGKAGPTDKELPYTSRAKKVLELAVAEARDLAHEYVGTEHLLLGTIREERGIAAQVLTECGLTLDRAREEVVRLLGQGVRKSHGVSFMAEVTQIFPPELDALLAAPDHHKLLMENDEIRVLETRIEPGETTALHTHRWAAGHYVISWSQFVRRDESGKILLDTRETDFNQKPPQVLWGPPLTAHTVENVGSSALHIISTELKRAY